MPLTPGPVLSPDDLDRRRAPDEIDEVIDEIFGPDPSGSPGKLDAVLLVVGCGLLLWAQLDQLSPVVTVVGGALILLGSILPIRSLWRRAKGRRSARRREALTSQGLTLNVAHPLTRDLVSAYQELLEAAEIPDAPLAIDASSAAHLALTESAVLVGEAGPTTAAEAEYVQRRTSAIRELAMELERHSRLADQGRSDERDAERSIQRVARALAGEELDATGLSSLRELDDLKRVLTSRSDD